MGSCFSLKNVSVYSVTTVIPSKCPFFVTRGGLSLTSNFTLVPPLLPADLRDLHFYQSKGSSICVQQTPVNTSNSLNTVCFDCSYSGVDYGGSFRHACFKNRE